jgi:succinate-semialdehyde dehydrogenase/glutarate-semialdehyde dehydrogenase
MIPIRDSSLIRSQAYIDGHWVSSVSGKSFEVANPADATRVGRVADLEIDQVRDAIDAAESAWPAWRERTAKDRAALLMRWRDLVLENQDDLAAIMTLEQGKPLGEARNEIRYAASFIEWFAEEGKRVYGDVIPAHAPDKRIVTLKQPIGVVAAITPWNFPSAMVTRKVAPALAAGCTIVVKPASSTPLSALALAELADRAGLPAGVLNVVPSARASAIGAELTGHPKIRKLSFTGSTEIGKALMQQCASSVKKVSLELGGNAPFIVFDDADLDAAVAGAIASKFRNAGQTCVCANRILVQDAVHDEFVRKLCSAVNALKVGAGDADGVAIGPLIDSAAVAKVEELVADAIERGAVVAFGGKRHALGGSFFEPTVLIHATTEMACANEEIFGPVAPIFRFSGESQAIEMANDTPYGLAAYFYARDIGRVWRVAEALEYGIVGINEGIISTEVAPFGGVKESGIGREGSKYGIEEYLEIKYLCMGGVTR